MSIVPRKDEVVSIINQILTNVKVKDGDNFIFKSELIDDKGIVYATVIIVGKEHGTDSYECTMGAGKFGSKDILEIAGWIVNKQ